MAIESYKYFAFISYRGTDVEIAKKLQKKFNEYKLPSTYKNPFDEKNQRMQPVCRDRDNFVGGEISPQIKDAIDHSMYVVMICTPNMTRTLDKENYVNDEVNHLIETNRINRLIPLVYDGRAYSANNYIRINRPIEEPFENESLPYTLRKWMADHIDHEYTLNIFNIEEQGERDEDKMFLRCVATILAQEFNKLWNRYEIEQKKRKRNIIISTVLSITIFISAIVLTYQYEQYQEQPFESKITLKERTVYPNLPPPEKIEISICFDGVWRRDTITHIGDSAVFGDILAKFKKQQIRMQVRNVCFLPMDTILTLCDHLQIPLQRDINYYGKIRILLLDDGTPICNQTVYVNDMPYSTDADGILYCHIPLEKQSGSYIVEYNGISAKLYMPCEGTDCLQLNNQ